MPLPAIPANHDVREAMHEAFAAIAACHPQIEMIFGGHQHRSIHARVGSRPALTCPRPAHQVAIGEHDGAHPFFGDDGELIT